jgi:hypothetical protein
MHMPGGAGHDQFDGGYFTRAGRRFPPVRCPFDKLSLSAGRRPAAIGRNNVSQQHSGDCKIATFGLSMLLRYPTYQLSRG